jgi:hypothetical protein
MLNGKPCHATHILKSIKQKQEKQKKYLIKNYFSLLIDKQKLIVPLQIFLTGTFFIFFPDVLHFFKHFPDFSKTQKS